LAVKTDIVAFSFLYFNRSLCRVSFLPGLPDHWPARPLEEDDESFFVLLTETFSVSPIPQPLPCIVIAACAAVFFLPGLPDH
jgi:hypothetical protein